MTASTGSSSGAEAHGACRTAGGPATLRGPIRGQIEDTLAVVKSGPGCPEIPYLSLNTYVCVLNSSFGGSRSAIDLEAVLRQIKARWGPGSVTDNSVVWIEAWGGDGGRGASAHGGDGGAGGYAQTTTTVDHLREFFGTSEL